LILSSNHGYSDKHGVEHDVSKGLKELLGLIDGSSKGKLPNEKEGEDARQ